MEKTLYFTGEYTGKVIVDYIHNVNYAMVLNNYKVFNSFVIMSMSSSVVPHMNVRISGDMLEATSFDIAELQPNHSVSLENINLIPSMSKLMALTEAFQTSFTITISIDGKEIHRESLPLLLMPFDQWHGDYVMPEDEYRLPKEEGHNQITFYWTYPGVIENADIWVWWDGKEGSGYLFHECNYGVKAVINVPEGIDRVGFIVRRDCSEPGGSAWGTATKDFGDDRFAVIEGKKTYIYLKIY